MSGMTSERFPCCRCCMDDPVWHEDNPRDTHETDCPTCSRTPLATEVARLTADNARLREGIEALHGPVDQFEPCPNGGWGCDEDVCIEDAYSGERYHVDQPCGPACLTCRDEDGGRDDWPCETAALLNPPTEGETDADA